MADKIYKHPLVFPESGPWNHEEYLNEAVDIGDYVVKAGDDPGTHIKPNDRDVVELHRHQSWVTLKGPVKVAVSAIRQREKPEHITEIVTVPPNTTVRIVNREEEVSPGENVGVAPVSVPKPLQTAAITGVPSGAAGAVGGQYFMENPLVGIVTAIVGGGAGYWWENSQYAEYGAERVE